MKNYFWLKVLPLLYSSLETKNVPAVILHVPQVSVLDSGFFKTSYIDDFLKSAQEHYYRRVCNLCFNDSVSEMRSGPAVSNPSRLSDSSRLTRTSKSGPGDSPLTLSLTGI